MRLKRLGVALLVCMMVFSFAAAPVNAASEPGDSSVVMRFTGEINHSISANTIAPINDIVYLKKDNKVSFNCTYTPKYSSMDFGYIDSDNVFHYMNCVNGSIDLSVIVAKTGQYTLAIRNNEDYAVTVKGTIKY